MWNADNGEELLVVKGAPHAVTSVAFSPDSKRILGGVFDSTVRVWDAGTGQEVFTLKAHVQPVSSVAYSADGKRILSGGGSILTRSSPARSSCGMRRRARRFSP